MIVPFTNPENGRLINLAHVVQVRVTPQPALKLDVKLVTGETIVFIGEAAEIFNREIAFAITTYRRLQQEAMTPESTIVPATGLVQ